MVASSIPHLVTCIAEINCRMSANCLKLNTDKTQFILLYFRQQLVNVKRKSISLGDVDIPFSDDITCLGVVFDNEPTFSTLIKRFARKCFYHLHHMRSVCRSQFVNAQNTSQCVRNKSNRLLQQCFQSGRSQWSVSSSGLEARPDRRRYANGAKMVLGLVNI